MKAPAFRKSVPPKQGVPAFFLRTARGTAPRWLGILRAKARARIEALGVPDAASEAWRHFDLGPVLSTDFADSGKLSAPAARGKNASPVILESLAAALRRPGPARENLGAGIDAEKDVFALVNLLRFRDGIFLFVPPGVDAGSVEIPLAAAPATRPAMACPRLLVLLGAGSKCRIVIRSAARAGARPFFLNTVAEFHLCRGARAEVSMLRETAEGGFEFFAARARLDKAARLDVTGIDLGGGVARADVSVFMNGAESAVSLRGLSVLSGCAEVHNHTVVHHAAPATTSRQVYKDILLGKSRSEYGGLVHVHRDGMKADSNQLNRNLLLSDEARAYSRPQLKIDADDVKCSHGSTTGQLPPEEIFYLRSRGLAAEAARSILIHGFANEIVQQVPEGEARAEFERRVAGRLEEVRQ